MAQSTLASTPHSGAAVAPSPEASPSSRPAPAHGVQRRVSASRAGSFGAQEQALAPVQRHGGKDDAGAVHAAAGHGISGSGGAMPHGGAIQKAFGGYDISHVQAHTDSAAAEGSRAMGAEAYATGDHVAFDGAPDLHTAAHEAAHVVQQEAGVQLSGGVGAVGDRYEQHADQVADAVVAGESAEPLLAQMAGGPVADGGVQQRAVQREEVPDPPQRNGIGVANPGKHDNGDATADRAAMEGLAGHAAAGDMKSATEHPTFDIFRARVANLNSALNLGLDVDKTAQDLWAKFLQGLVASERELDSAETISGTKYIASDKAYSYEQVDGKARNRILDPFSALISDVNPWLNSMCARANSFAFWSSDCAKAVAMTKGGADIGLESSAIGSLFDDINFTGDWDNQLWAAISRAYSQAIVANLSANKQIRVYASHRSRTSNTTFTSVEKPVIGPAVEGWKAVAPSMMVYVGCAPVVKLNAAGNAVEVQDAVPDWTQAGFAGIPGTVGAAADQPGAVAVSTDYVAKRKAELEASIPKQTTDNAAAGGGTGGPGAVTDSSAQGSQTTDKPPAG